MTHYPQEKIKPYNESEGKAVQVEKMFDNIAPAYDKLNHLLSLDIDKSWRRKAIRLLKPYRPQHIMDVATGTGDFAIQAYRMLQPEELIGTDISEGMMNIGREKVKQMHLDKQISFAKEDCTTLSFPDNRFDAITVAFGIRNFENLDKGLQEMHRVLVPGGHNFTPSIQKSLSLIWGNCFRKTTVPIPTCPTPSRLSHKERQCREFFAKQVSGK